MIRELLNRWVSKTIYLLALIFSTHIQREIKCDKLILLHVYPMQMHACMHIRVLKSAGANFSR